MAATKPSPQPKAAKKSESEKAPKPTHKVIDPTFRIHGKNKNVGDEVTLTDAQARLPELQKKIERL
ncbi:hypothetical protein [Vibrio aquimaris]|uniref:Uncharacterized protein n=1 Tax=Vibrio aquimaris TaxID=2587862 RepID=A0A5P9CRG2_9VIBR|nr:hypothetical protein [Vibrio aquimaris]QFT28794.1 hypothetical protein FIV01_20545 [Vibrio aquimaris]